MEALLTGLVILILIFFFFLDWLPGGRRIEVSAMLNRSAPPITNLLLVDSILTGDWSLFGGALRHLLLDDLRGGAGRIGR